MLRRLFVSLGLGIVFGYIAFQWCASHGPRPGGDFALAWMQAKELFAGRNPYPVIHPILYPLTAVIFAIPFTLLPANLAGAVFFGGSCALLAFFMSKQGWWRLLIFLGMPFPWALVTVQWVPLMVASVFIPWIGAMTLKPQIGIPCAVRSEKWSAVWSAALFGFLSLAVRPSWPIEFLHQAARYPNFSPIFYLCGLPLSLALFWWRDRDARFLLLMAVMPQRFLYDAMPLWLLPRSWREMLFLTACSWAGFAFYFHALPITTYDMIWNWSFYFTYVPAFLIIAYRKLSEMRAAVSRPAPVAACS